MNIIFLFHLINNNNNNYTKIRLIIMTELDLQQYLQREYPQENARCEWKEFKNLKNSFCGNEKDDVISYVSAIANMEEE